MGRPLPRRAERAAVKAMETAAGTAMANGNGNGGGNGNGNSGSGSPGNSGNGNGAGNGNSGNGGGHGNGSGSPGNSGNAGENGSGGSGVGNGGSAGSGNGNGGNPGNSGGNAGGKGSGNGNDRGGHANSGHGNSSSPPSHGGGQSRGNGQPPAPTAAGGLPALLDSIFGGVRPRAAVPTSQAVSAPTRKDAAKSQARSPGRTSKPAASRPEQGAKAQASKSRKDDKGAKDVRSAGAKPAAVGTSAAIAEPSLPKPRQAPRSIVAAGLTPGDLTRLSAQGFRVAMRTKGTIASVARLIPPRGLSLAQAQRAVRLVDARAASDFDHFYYTDEGEGCAGPGCEAASLVGWNLPAADSCGSLPAIGLIDTGIDRQHEVLRGQAIDILPGAQLRGSPSQRDHGTAMAALLVGRRDSSAPGLLPEAKILAVDAFYRDGGTADRTDVISLVMALEALAERNVRVVNMSLSGPPNEVLKSAIASAQAKGMVIVAAAGNNGAGAEPSYPAAYPGVIAVTAVDRNLGVYPRATHGEYVDLSAPGVDLWVAAPGRGGTVKSGTSYAVPFVAASAAVLRAANPDLDAASLRATLERATLDLGKPGRDTTFGHGLIQTANLCRSPQQEPVLRSASGTKVSPN